MISVSAMSVWCYLANGAVRTVRQKDSHI